LKIGIEIEGCAAMSVAPAMPRAAKLGQEPVPGPAPPLNGKVNGVQTAVTVAAVALRLAGKDPEC
jgi:hypothetical protein